MKRNKYIYFILILVIINNSCKDDSKEVKSSWETRTIESLHLQLYIMLRNEATIYRAESSPDEVSKKYNRIILKILDDHEKLTDRIDSIYNNSITESSGEEIYSLINAHCKYDSILIDSVIGKYKNIDGLQDFIKWTFDFTALDSLNIILDDSENIDELFINLLKLRILMLDDAFVKTIMSLKGIGSFSYLKPEMTVIEQNDTIQLGDQYSASFIYSINHTRLALEFKINEVVENGKNTKVDFNVDTTNKYLNIKYTPKSTGEVIFKGYVKYQPTKFSDVNYIPVEHKIYVK